MITPQKIATIELGVDIFLMPPVFDFNSDEVLEYLTQSDIERLKKAKSKKFRLEYATSRWLMRTLLGKDAALDKCDGGSIQWPNGVKGSLSHKENCVAFAMTRDQSIHSIGIDIESIKPMIRAVKERVFIPKELELIESQRHESEGLLAAAGFAFKEALFKCHFPLGGKRFYFHDAEIIETDVSDGHLGARLNVTTIPKNKAGGMVTGRFVLLEELDLVLTLVVERE